MRKLLRASRAPTFLLAFVALVVAAAGGAVAATSVGSNTITVCVSNRGGVLYTAKACKNHDGKLRWNKQGPRGFPGPSGSQGPQGAAGQNGQNGTNGVIALRYVVGAGHTVNGGQQGFDEAKCPADAPYVIGGGAVADARSNCGAGP